MYGASSNVISCYTLCKRVPIGQIQGMNSVVTLWTRVEAENDLDDYPLIARVSSTVRRSHPAFFHHDAMAKPEDNPTQTNNIV